MDSQSHKESIKHLIEINHFDCLRLLPDWSSLRLVLESTPSREGVVVTSVVVALFVVEVNSFRNPIPVWYVFSPWVGHAIQMAAAPNASQMGAAAAAAALALQSAAAAVGVGVGTTYHTGDGLGSATLAQVLAARQARASLSLALYVALSWSRG